MASTLRFDNWENSNGDSIFSATGGFLNAPGSVLQVVSTTKGDTFTTSTTSMVDIPGFSVSITPKLSNSKILVIASINAGTIVQNFGYLQVVRDSTPIFVGDSSTSRPSVSAMYYTEGNQGVITSISISHLDSPNTTNPVTYKVQCRTATGGGVYINRSGRDSAATDYDARVPSSITVMEIAG